MTKPLPDRSWREQAEAATYIADRWCIAAEALEQIARTPLVPEDGPTAHQLVAEARTALKEMRK